MADLSQLMGSGQKPKFSWKKPEGVAGIALIGGMVALAGYAFYKIIPPLLGFLLTTLTQGIAVIVLGSIALALLALITNKKFILAMKTLVETVARRFSRMVVRLDPIAVANGFVAKTDQKLKEVDEGIQQLVGFIRRAKDKLARSQEEFTASMERAKQAREHGKKGDLILAVRKAGRREKRSVSLNDQLKRLERLLEIFKKYREALQLLRDDTKDEVEAVSEDWEQMKAANSLMKSMRSILSPNSDEQEMFLDAMQYMMDDKLMKLGEIEGFFDMTQSVISSMDLDNLVIEERGLAQLDAWERKLAEMEGTLLQPTAGQPLLTAGTPNFSDVLLRDRGIAAPEELRQVSGGGKFRDILKQ